MSDPSTAYCNKTLIGNWFDDRLSQAWAASNVSNVGQSTLKNNPIASISKVDTDFYTTSSKAAYIVPSAGPKARDYTMMSKGNVYDSSRVPEARLPRHGKDRSLALYESTTHSHYGGKHADSLDKKAFKSKAAPLQRMDPASLAKRKRGIKTGGATGEVLKVDHTTDPKSHTFVQRAWLYDRSSYQIVNDKAKYDAILEEKQKVDILQGLGQNKSRPDQPHYRRKTFNTASSDGIWSG
jgi:hypothetical protein